MEPEPTSTVPMRWILLVGVVVVIGTASLWRLGGKSTRPGVRVASRPQEQDAGLRRRARTLELRTHSDPSFGHCIYSPRASDRVSSDTFTVEDDQMLEVLLLPPEHEPANASAR